MHNPAPVLENATHKLLWDFNIQTREVVGVFYSTSQQGDQKDANTMEYCLVKNNININQNQ